jgi:GTP-binding protein EngB required for normal cell division
VSAPAHLNESQRRHLLSSCQYADKLLAQIETALAESQSKSPFPKCKPDLSAVQAKVIHDYIARMRAQLLRALDSQSVAIPAAQIGALHSIRVTIGFVDIAFDECRPERMAGYGDVPPAAATEIAGMVDEMRGLVARLDSYLAQGGSADLNQRLQRLQESGGDVALVQTLERAIDQHGLVEFRPALATIVERLESDAFEIAAFGRVSSGKSSLLNHIAGEEILPVGVTPITAVPTRLAYGAERRATAWLAGRKPEQFPIERLAEFVTEQHNPANIRHVTQIVMELPAQRLREGVVYVDTPGLGSLATSGSAETKAYLPRCDLGVVLIDAGSTLTDEDLATIHALYEAGIPASVLLSKADLLAPADCDRALEYVAGHIRSDLGLELPVRAVSIRPGFGELLEAWLASDILPLYDRHAELARQSLARKIGALRLAVEAALKPRRIDAAHLRGLDTELRAAAGAIAQARAKCLERADALRSSADRFIRRAAESSATGVRSKLEGAAADEAARIVSAIQDVTRHAARVLAKASTALELANRPEPEEFLEVLKNMPRLDLGSLDLDVDGGVSIFGRRLAAILLERRIRWRAGEQIDGALATYSGLLRAWVTRTFAELLERFDSYAGAYRAQLDRAGAGAA